MPTMLEVMQSRVGIKEVAGKKHNPVIVGWAKQVGWESIKDDETAWCSICMCAAADDAKLPMPPHNNRPLALSWLTWGVKVEVEDAQAGDVAIWPRGDSSWQGHVNIIESIDDLDRAVCIGGNQSNAVTRTKPLDLRNARGIRRAVPATVPALRQAGSSEIKEADRIQNAGTLQLAGSLLTAGVAAVLGPVEQVPDFKSPVEALSFWQQLGQGLVACGKLVAAHPWLAGVVVLGLACLWVGATRKKARVRKHKAGVPISAQLKHAAGAQAA